MKCAALPAPSSQPLIIRRLKEGLQLQSQGRADLAEQLFRSVLAIDPGNFDALHLIGVARSIQGHDSEGADYISRALELDPKHPDALFNSARILGRLKRFNEAIERFDRLLAIVPAHQQALILRGEHQLDVNRCREALESFDRALSLDPQSGAALIGRGDALFALGRTDEALLSCEEAVRLQPRNVKALSHWSDAMCSLRLHHDALAGYNRILAIDSRHPEGLFGRARCLIALDSLDIEAIDRCIAQLREIASQTARDAGAAAAVETLNMCGILLAESGRAPQALDQFEEAAALSPDEPSIHFNRANVLAAMNELSAAVANYDRALALAPDLPYAQWNRALLLLRSGDYANGFSGYEWRFKGGVPGKVARKLPGPEWRPGDDLKGKKLFLYAEQGYGDVIHFCRFAPILAETGVLVHLEVQPELKSICSSLSPKIIVSAIGESLPPFDLHFPLLSVPHRMNFTGDAIPANFPYVHADASKVEHWRAKLQELSGRRKIGIVWSGSPTHVNDKNRSMPLQALAQLFHHQDIDFVSLQKVKSPDDAGFLANCPRVIDVGEELKDFSDTAAAIETLDLVISVDTSVAHLTGALGKPVWILLPYSCDWRWLCDRSDSPWYPTATLFRQVAPRDWGTTIDRIDALLGDAVWPVRR